jgi:serine/threonine protein phosphatase 1
MFLEFIEGRMSAAKAKYWLERCGGAETLQSYGQNGESDLAAEAIRSNYHHHINMLRRASSLVRVGGLVACHAGINAWLPIDEQHRHDLMWITDGFLDRVDDRMPPVVHGHTPMGELPVVTENRISIDTEAYETGRLTAFFLDRIERKCAFYQTSKESPVREVTPIFHNRGKGCVLDRADLMTL